ncbi:MAG: glutamate--tRNA ligase [Deltaproteobacteria bacterium RIFCSPHIGHO2_12_FULL_43_9]|nr:MAG: glutamate--tRNA ligase [Deltaproteobacteria bacterium RIFCSPHIGHO2_12_FULL_43_9]
MSDVRVRFAPSPTGSLHVGGARTALYNWLFARHTGGKFILRIEDTDQARSTRESEESVVQDLKWLGLNWDEGPDVGGEYGPYRQSERHHIYKGYADKLLKEGIAYKCYCTDEELTRKRDEAFSKGQIPQYDGTCRDLDASAQQKLQLQGGKPAIRFKIPKGAKKLNDLIRGLIEFPEGMVGDFIIVKHDGFPTYNFAVVVDDALMKITHVLRAEEHLSNTNRQLMLFEALKFPIPQFGHFALVMGRDESGNVSKLSKRHGATSVAQYRDTGVIPDALNNYLALLGWSHPEAKEHLSKEELIKSFSLERVGKSPSIFDVGKFEWLSGLYIRGLSTDELIKRTLPFFGDSVQKYSKEQLANGIHVIAPSVRYLSEIPEKFFDAFDPDKFVIDEESKVLLKAPQAKVVVECFEHELTQWKGESISPDILKGMINSIKEKSGAKGKALFQPLRAAVTGKLSGPELDQVIQNIGKEGCLARIAKTKKEISWG